MLVLLFIVSVVLTVYTASAHYVASFVYEVEGHFFCFRCGRYTDERKGKEEEMSLVSCSRLLGERKIKILSNQSSDFLERL